MKKIYLFTLLLIVLTLFTACKSGGTFAMHNRTSFPVWASVEDGVLKEISAGESHEFKVDTSTQSFLTGEVKRKVKVKVFGETFSLFDTSLDTPGFTDSTYTTVKAGRTTNAFLHPNRACIKIINNRAEKIALAEIWQHKTNTQARIATFEDILYGEEKWIRVDHVSQANSFYYRIAVIMNNGDQFFYGGPDLILDKDEQFVVTINPLPF